MKKLLYLAVAAMLFAACGTLKKATVTPVLPDREHADSIARALVRADSPMVTFPIEDASGMHIFAFLPSSDSASLKIIDIIPDKDVWAVASDADYPCFDGEGLTHKDFVDSLAVKEFGGAAHLLFSTWRESADAKEAQKTIVLYCPSTTTLRSLSFTGKYLADGRIEGSSNRNLIIGADSPEMRWAIAAQASDKTLLELSEADLMADQSIEWWLKNNPAVFSNATKVSFGQLPQECSLVTQFNALKKESSAKYRAAMFDFRGYTVIVASRRQDGSCFLAWAEPVCKDKNKDRLLNNIYFENESSLVLFYYKGRKTFKYRLNLSSGKLTR